MFYVSNSSSFSWHLWDIKPNFSSHAACSVGCLNIINPSEIDLRLVFHYYYSISICRSVQKSKMIELWKCHVMVNRDVMTFVVYTNHDDVTEWKHFPRYWPFVRGIHRSPVNSPHKGQWCGALMHSLICAWINGWVNNREPGDLRRPLWRHSNSPVDSMIAII